MDKSKRKKIGRIVTNVILYVFLAICIFSVFFTMFSKKDPDGATEIFGYQMRVVTSESMAKCDETDVSDYRIKDIPLRSMVFVKVKPRDAAELDEWYRNLEEGDVLTFRYVYTSQVTITHRITSITEKPNGGFIIELAGDNKNADNGQLEQVIDTSIPNNTNYVIGKVVGQARLFGLVMSLLMNPIGIVLVIMLPCVIIMMLEFIKIAKLLSADKREKERAESAKKDTELEELRRRLAELEANKENGSSEGDDNKGGDTV